MTLKYTLKDFATYAKTGSAITGPDLFFKFYKMINYIDGVQYVLFIPKDILCYFNVTMAKIEINGRIIHKNVYFPSGYDYASVLDTEYYKDVYFESADEFLVNVANYR